MPVAEAATPGMATPVATRASVGPPVPQAPVPWSSPRTPSPVWDLLADPGEQGHGNTTELPRYVTVGHEAFGATEVAAQITGGSVVALDEPAPQQPPGASIVAAVVNELAEGINASPETPGAVIRRKPPAAQAGASKRKFLTLACSTGVIPLHLEGGDDSAIGSSAIGASAGATANAVVGCVTTSPDAHHREREEQGHSKRARNGLR